MIRKLSGNIKLIVEKTIFSIFLILYVEEISSTLGESYFRKAIEQDLLTKELLWISTKFYFVETSKGLALLDNNRLVSVREFLTKEKFIPLIEHLKNGSR